MSSLRSSESIATAQGSPQAPATHRATARLLPALGLLLLFGAALLPRLTPGLDFLTVDEAYHWYERVLRFRDALRAGDYSATLLTGHPGVTTLWLGLAGLEFHDYLMRFEGITADPALFRSLLRAPLALVAALGIVLAFPLLRRLFNAPFAWLACLFWATSPFLVAHAQLLHLDSLLTTFMSLALLTALLAFRFDETIPGGPPRRGMLIVSGIAGGLALLTKSPALLLGPLLLILAVTAAWRSHGAIRPRSLIGAGILWTGTALLVVLLLWPALWADPGVTIGRYLAEIIDNGGAAHGWGNFFAGQAVADPGPLFYPTAIALRLAPWILPGLLAAALLLPFEPERRRRTLILLLAGFVLFFVVTLSLPAKKFDRYALPVFPALSVIAAYGWLAMLGRLFGHMAGRQRVMQTAWLLGIAAMAGLLFWYRSYPLAYYNPLLGGSNTAVHMIPVGWGEGLEAAGSYITQQADGCSRPIATWYRPVLDPFVCHRVVPLDAVDNPAAAGYAVLYIDQIQRENRPDITRRLMEDSAPLHIIRIHGIDYARIYHLPPPIAEAVSIDFGDAIQLTGYEFGPAALNGEAYLNAKFQWRSNQVIEEELLLFVHLFDAQGQKIGQADVVLGGPENPAQQWQPNRYQTMPQRVPIFAPGTQPAWLALGIYRPGDFSRLEMAVPLPPGAPDAGPNALLLPLP